MSNRNVNPAAGFRIPRSVAPLIREEHDEGTLTRMIEQQTARVSSDVFLFLALATMGASLALELAGRTRWSRFIGMWPPNLLIMGVYNKLVKLHAPH